MGTFCQTVLTHLNIDVAPILHYYVPVASLPHYIFRLGHKHKNWQCEMWARRHGSTFAPKKYELIHFARNPKRFNMAATITIGGETKVPKTDIRVLGIQIDTKLKWGPHVKKIQEKMVTQTRALTKLTASTWGATFAKARQVYCAVIRPAITYGLAVWHCPSAIKGAGKGNVDKLAVIQNKCLRVVAGAYKATLHAEAMVLPMKEHLEQLQAKTRTRLKTNGQAAFSGRCGVGEIKSSKIKKKNLGIGGLPRF